MRLTHVKIRNILGIEELDFEPGEFTVIEGPNGSGKTSVMEALKALGRGGTDATLLRRGAKEGEVVWLFDDGSSVRKRLSEKGVPTVTMKDGDGRSKSSPQAAIDALVDMMSMNPVGFLLAEPRRRVDVLLDSLPMQADPVRIRDIVGDPALPIVGDHALKQIDNAYTIVFDERTGTGRAAREKEGTINQLKATLPASGETGGELGDEDGLQAQVDDIERRRSARMAEIDTKLDTFRTEHETQVQGWRDQIRALERQISDEVAAFAEVRVRAGTARTTANAEFDAEKAPVTAELARIRADRDAAVRARTTRETIDRLEAEAEGLRQDMERQTTALDALTAYKTEMLAALPIDGLEVRDGQIFRHGVPFDRLNKAQQVEIAVEVAKLRAGELKVICVDELERLDTEHFEAFRDQAIASGLQLIVTRVSDDDFAIRAEG